MRLKSTFILMALLSTYKVALSGDSLSQSASVHSSPTSHQQNSPLSQSPSQSPHSPTQTIPLSLKRENYFEKEISATGVVVINANSQVAAVLDVKKQRQHNISKPVLLMAEMAHNHLSAALTDSSSGKFRARSNSMAEELRRILNLINAAGYNTYSSQSSDVDTDDSESEVEV